MSCYICGQMVDEPKLDPRDMKTAPCGTCEAVIQECIDSYPKVKDQNDEEETSSEDYVVYLEPDVDDFRDLYKSSTRKDDY